MKNNASADQAALPSAETYSRRAFVVGAGAMLLANGTGLGRPRSTAGRGVIDVHHHILPPAYLAARRDQWRRISVGFPAASDWTPQRSIDDMDRSEVRTAVVSISVPGVWNGNVGEAVALARTCNEYTAQLKRDYPGRFGHFAVIPLPDIDGSLKELEYALDSLHAEGVGLYTNYTDRYLGDAAFAPFLEELNRRKVVAFVHPTTNSCCTNLMPGVGPAILEFPSDTARAVSSLLWSGSLSRFPNIRFIFSHGGGAVPMVAERIALWADVHPDIQALLPHGAMHELARLRVDTAYAANPIAFAAMRKLFSVNNIVFGTDFPFGSAQTVNGALQSLGLKEQEIAAVRRGNTLALLPGLA
jgi:predicted TIM-barrel fold metal-dependent hydrolase